MRRRRRMTKGQFGIGKIADPSPTITLPRDPGSALASLKPHFRKVHRIGGCSVVEYKLGQYGLPSFICTFKKVKADRINALEAVRAVRSQFPRRMVGEIPALRVWKLVGEHLSPVTRKTDFETGPVMVADQKPTKINTSGLWAIRCEDHPRLKDLITQYGADVYGIVGLFGRVVEHEHGYRAEKMMIMKLVLLFPSSQNFRDCLAQRYECEVVEEIQV